MSAPRVVHLGGGPLVTLVAGLSEGGHVALDTTYIYFIDSRDAAGLGIIYRVAK